ncbi:MFS transporter, partial [Mycobacterium avium]|uniref:MFS transporter n=1 Tax=Mycobacterium avium TaxID=1764 RepID=UPI0004947C93
MMSSNVRAARNRPGRTDPQPPTGAPLFVGVLGLLLATGWVANHFVGLMPAISDRDHLATTTLDGIFGIYALGLLPGLLVGGRTSDALGRRPVALTGSAAALVGTVAMLLSQHSPALFAGRLIVGLGVGLAISAGTAWASDLRGPAGAATAGAVLTAGFAVGPFAGGVRAWAGPSGVRASFALAAAILALAAFAVVAAPQPSPVTAPADPDGEETADAAPQGISRALSWAMPLAPWVFASATLGFVTIPGRLHTALAAPVAAGTATLIVNGVSGAVQVLARALRWGPQAGTAGAVLAALGYAVASGAAGE